MAIAASNASSSNGSASAVASIAGASPRGRCARIAARRLDRDDVAVPRLVGAGARADVDDGPRVAERGVHAGGDARVGAAVARRSRRRGARSRSRRRAPAAARSRREPGLEAADGRAQRRVRAVVPSPTARTSPTASGPARSTSAYAPGARLVAEAPERDPVVGGERPQHPRVGRKLLVRAGRDDAPRRRQADRDPHPARSRQRASDEVVLGERAGPVAVVEDEVRAEAPDVPRDVRVQGAEVGERAGREQVDRGEVLMAAGRAQRPDPTGRRSASAHRPLEQVRQRGRDVGALRRRAVGRASRARRRRGAARRASRGAAGRSGRACWRSARPWRGRRPPIRGRPRPRRRLSAAAGEALAEHRLDRVAAGSPGRHRRTVPVRRVARSGASVRTTR